MKSNTGILSPAAEVYKRSLIERDGQQLVELDPSIVFVRDACVQSLASAAARASTDVDDRWGRDVIVSTDHRDLRGDIIRTLPGRDGGTGIDTTQYERSPIVLLMHGKVNEFPVIGGRSKLKVGDVKGMPALEVEEFLFSDDDLGRKINGQWNDRILNAASIAVIPTLWFPLNEAGDRLDPEARSTPKLMAGVDIASSIKTEWSIVTRGADPEALRRAWEPTKTTFDLGARPAGIVPGPTGTTTGNTGPVPERDDDRPYARAAEYVAETPWAVLPSMMATITAILAERRGGYRPTPEEIRERLGSRRRDDAEHIDPEDISDADLVDALEPIQVSPVRVIEITGVISSRGGSMQKLSGIMSAENLISQVNEAARDDSVKAIVFDIDSPGGSVSLIPELAEAIRDAGREKTVVSVANTMAASAAYWVGSSAGEFVVTPSAMVGSLGVFSAHEDLTAQLEQEGVKITEVTAGRFKAELSPFRKLSDGAQAEMQRKVDAWHGMFIADVALGRGTSEADVRENFGAGRMFMAAQAVEVGMADRIATLPQVIAQLEARIAAAGEVETITAELDDGAATEVSDEDAEVIVQQGAAASVLKRTSLEQCPGCQSVAIYWAAADQTDRGGFLFHRRKDGDVCHVREHAMRPIGPTMRTIAMAVRDSLPHGESPAKELHPEARDLVVALGGVAQIRSIPDQVSRLVEVVGSHTREGRVLSAETRTSIIEALTEVEEAVAETEQSVGAIRGVAGSLIRFLATADADTPPGESVTARLPKIAIDPRVAAAVERL